MTNPSKLNAPNDRVGSGSLIQRYRRLSLGVKILLFMVLGIVAGIIAGERAEVVQPLGDLFIRLRRRCLPCSSNTRTARSDLASRCPSW